MLLAGTWQEKTSQTDGAAWPGMGNGKGSGEGETMSHICHLSPCAHFTGNVATFPAGIHIFGIKMFWGATASTGLLDAMGMGLDLCALPVPKAPNSQC